MLLAFRLFFVAAVITFITISKKLKTPEQCDWAAFAATLIGAILLVYITRYSTGLAHGDERRAVDRDKLLLALPWEFDLPCLSGIADHYRKRVGLP